MPDLRQTLILKVQAKDLDKLIDKLKEADIHVEKVDAKGGKLGKAFKQMGERAARWVKGVAVASFAALAGTIVKATKAAADFERGMAEVASLVNTAEVNMAELRNGILGVAKDTPQSIDDLTRALYQTISAGVDAADAIELVNQAARSAKAGATETRVAVDGLTTVLNAWGLSVESSQEVSDAFFIAVRDGKTTFEELSASIGQVAPIAAQLGVSYEEVLAATAALTKGGLATAEAMTQIRSALVAVAKQTNESKKAAKELGVEFTQGGLAAKGLQAFLQDVATAADGDAEALNNLFGRVEGMSAAMALGGNQAQSFADTLGNMETRAGATDEAFGKMMDTASGLWSVLKSQLSVALVELGEKFLPAVITTMEGVISIFEAFDSQAEKTLRRMKDLGAEGLVLLRFKLEADIDALQDEADDAARAFQTAFDKRNAIWVSGVGLVPIEELSKGAVETLERVLGTADIGGAIDQALEGGTPALVALEEQFKEAGRAAQEAGDSVTAEFILDLVENVQDLLKANAQLERQTSSLTSKQETLGRVNKALASGQTEFKESIGDVVQAMNKEIATAKESAKTKEEFARAIEAAQATAFESIRELFSAGGLDDQMFQAAVDKVVEIGNAARQSAKIQRQASDDADKSDAKRVAAAKKLLAAMERTMEAQKFLNQLNEETKAFGEEVLRLNEEIAAAKLASADLSGEEKARLEAITAELERQRDARMRELESYDDAVHALELLEQGAIEAAMAILDVVDPDAAIAAMETMTRQLTERISQFELNIPIRVEQGESEAVLKAELERMKEEGRKTAADLSKILTAAFPKMADQIRVIFSEAFRKMKPETKKVAEGVVDNFRDTMSQAAREFDLTGDFEVFERSAEAAFQTAIGELEAMVEAGELTEEEMKKIVAVLEKIRDASVEAGGAFSKFAAVAQGIGSAVNDVAELADALGLVDEGTKRAIEGFGQLVDSVGQLGASIGQIASGNPLGIIQGIGGAIKSVTGIVGGIKKLFGGKSKQELEAERREREAARKAQERLRMALIESAKRIERAVMDFANQAFTGEGFTGEQISRFRNEIERLIFAFDNYQMFIDRMRSGEPIFTYESGGPRQLSPQEVGLQSQQLNNTLIEVWKNFLDESIAGGLLDESIRARYEALLEDGLTPFEAISKILDEEGLRTAFDEFVENAAGFGDSIAGALEEVAFLIRFGGASVKEAFDHFIEDLTGPDAPELSEDLQALIDDIANATDPDEIRQKINEFANSFAGMTTGEREALLGNLEFGDLQAILDQFLQFADGLETATEEGSDAFARALGAASQAAADFAGLVDPEDIQSALDAFLSRLANAGDALGPELLDILGDVSQLDIESDAGQEELRAIIESWGQALSDGSSDVWEALGLTEEEFRSLAQELSGFLLPEFQVPEDPFAQARQALSDFSSFVSDDPTAALQTWVQALRDNIDELDPALDQLLSSLEGIDLDDEAGQAQLDKIIAAFGEILLGDMTALDDLLELGVITEETALMIQMGGQTLWEALGLSEEQFRQLTQTASGFERQLSQISVDPVREAMDALSTFGRFVNDDATAGLQRFVSDLLSSGADLGDELTALLSEAGGLDIKSASGQERLKAIISTIASGLLTDRDFGAMTEDQVEAILGALDGLTKQGASQGEDFSRSVQSARIITETDANEIVSILNAMNFWVERIYREILRMEGVDIPEEITVPAITVNSEAPEELVRRLEELNLTAEEIRALVANLTPSDPPDVSVNVEPPEVNVEPPEINVEPPEVNVEPPEVETTVTVEPPEVEAPEPPDVIVEGPEIDVKPEIQVEGPEITVETPEVETPEVHVEAPELQVEAPEVHVEPPVIEPPDIQVEAPVVEAPVVNVAPTPDELLAVLDRLEAAGLTDEQLRDLLRSIPQPELRVETGGGPDMEIYGALLEELLKETREGSQRAADGLRDLLEGFRMDPAGLVPEANLEPLAGENVMGAELKVIFESIEINTEQSVDRVLSELEAQVQNRLYQAFPRGV